MGGLGLSKLHHFFIERLVKNGLFDAEYYLTHHSASKLNYGSMVHAGFDGTYWAIRLCRHKIATRYAKRTASFLAAAHIRCIALWVAIL